MRIEHGKEKRCSIVLFYDRNGIADAYFLKILEELRPETEKLIVVCNGWVQEESFARLEEYADEVILRVNEGFDVGAYREVLFYLGWKTLSAFEEVILMNYTFFVLEGSFHKMFTEMNDRDLDFWGITKHHRMPEDPYGHVFACGYMPEHLNSHFIAMRKSLFTSWAYRNFIFNLPNPSSRFESVIHYEAVFTKTFSDLGYVYDTYTDTDFMEGTHYYPALFGINRLLPNSNCPIIKRRVFYTDYIDYMDKTAGEASVYAYDWLKKHTDKFDLHLMWDNILRLENLPDIAQTLHLKYFPDSETTEHLFDKNEVLVIIHGTKEDLSPFYTRYEKELPTEWQRLYIDGSMSQALKRAAETAGRYQFVFFINLIDPKETAPYSNGVSLINREMENLCGSRALIGNLLEEFAQDDRLGMLVPPIPNHGIYFEKVRNGMGGQEDAIKVIAEKLGLQVPVRKSAAQPVFSWGGSFWIRAELLMRIIEIYDTADIEESVLLMLMPYFLQEMRYFTGTVIGTHYASLEAANLDYMMRETNRAVFERVGPDAYWVELRKLQDSMS